MSNYEIFTDSSCDLTKEIIEQFQLHVMQLEVFVDDKPPVLNNQIDIGDFYQQLRNGANAKTAAVTPGQFEEEMRKCLSEGKDIIYLGFSSGLSATYNNGVMIIKELRLEFPDRKIYDIDTLCASVGQGLVVYYAAVLRQNGATIEEVRDAVEAVKDRIQHQVTVNDLFFLKRGGRISTATAVAGSLLKFKPIIILDKEGKLQNIGKVRGRKTSIHELFNRMKENAKLEELGYVLVGHSDCIEDANVLAALVKDEFHPKQVIISDIGPVIGAHTGPGALVLTYLGTTTKGIQN